MQSATVLQTSLVKPGCFHTPRRPHVAAARRCSQQLCCAQKRDLPNFGLVAASCAAALLLQSSPVDAKVILEQPQSKKVFQGAAEQAKKAQESAEEAAPSFSAPSISLPKFKPPSFSPTIFSDSGDIDPRAVALPASLLFIGGGALVLSKVDPQFNEFMGNTSLKDSSTGGGAGYEQDVQQYKEAGDLKKGAKQNIKKVGTTINKKANTGGKQKKASPSKSGGGLRGVFGGK